MSKRFVAAVAAVCAWIGISTSLQAADPFQDVVSLTWSIEGEPIDKTNVVQVTLGTELDEFIIAPEKLRLVTGRHYKLVVMNPSSMTHFFWAPEFGGYATWSDRAQVDKGEVNLRQIETDEGEAYSTWEIKIEPGGTAVWEFVPVMAGRYKFGCRLPKHAHAGMESELEVGPEVTFPL